MNILTVPGYGQMIDDLNEIEQYVSRYTIADAIRDGSTRTEQCVGDWFDPERNTACALSAAYLAVAARSAHASSISA